MTSSLGYEAADRSDIEVTGMGLRFRSYEGVSPSIKHRLIEAVTGRTGSKVISRWLFKNFELNVHQGERVGIIGSNGAGKSTLLKVISGVYAPSEGRLSVVGAIVPLLELGTGFQAEYPAPDNILLNGSMLGLSRRQMLDRTDTILEFAELKDSRHLPIKYYSSGMVVRLALSIAMEVNPEILLIDEIFAGGDLRFIKKARDRLLGLIDSANIMLMVSHDLELIRHLTKRTIWLSNGKIVEDGATAEVVERYINQTTASL